MQHSPFVASADAAATDREWAPDSEFWRHRPVAVTGATGFLGSHVVGMLVDLGADVVILARDEVPATPVGRRWQGRVAVVRGRVEDHEVVARMLGEYRVATVLHLAGQSQVRVANENPLSTFEANVGGTWSVLEAVRRSPGVSGVVLAGSDAAYGEQRALPYSEELPLVAVQPYDVSKACADLVAASYAHSFGVPVVISRCGTFFGPGDTNWDALVPGTIRALVAGRRPVLRTDVVVTRDYLYVVDAALAHLLLAEALAEQPKLAGEVFNFSVERPLSVLEMVEMLQIGAGTHLEPDLQTGPGHQVTRRYLSAAKARQLLRWQSRHTIEEGVILTVRWYRDYLATCHDRGT